MNKKKIRCENWWEIKNFVKIWLFFFFNNKFSLTTSCSRETETGESDNTN